jgi:hypothetical protein
MSSNNTAEHFVTLFDSNFLPMGMALHDSLMAHGQPFHLWVVCMDELVEDQLERISLPNVTLIPLRAVETRELLDIKMGRTRGEYCWTITPFTFQAVFDRDDSVERVTYLDADLFFFASPQILLRELDESGKHVLITEHAYAPEYNKWLALSGRFCVQFLTFRRTMKAQKVMQWWQERCLEWCFARVEDGKFGDQKYLDSWPDLFADEIHIVRQTEKTLAPWNVSFTERRFGGRLDPVFYHFHGLRVVGPRKVRLCDNYRIGKGGLFLYRRYLEALDRSVGMLHAFGMPVPYKKERFSVMGTIRGLLYRMPRFMEIQPVLTARNEKE